MNEQYFLISLSNMTIDRNYDASYFENVFKLIKDFCEADEVVTDNFKRKGDPIVKLNINEDENDLVFHIDLVNTKIVVKNPKRKFQDKEMFEAFLGTILNNIFKNMILVEKLKKEKNIDSLLQVYNRNAYDEILNENNMHRMCGVAFVDANGLGVVNNMYGHESGDNLLKTVADCLKQYFRHYDIYRIGGDELVIIVENISKDLFLTKLDMATSLISKSPYTVSVGVMYQEEVDDLKQMVNEASIKMKENKEEYRRLHPEEYVNKYEVQYVGNNNEASRN
mgnify:FL=1